jgi:hypothetical protein
MPTHLDIDPDLLEVALAVSGEKTRKATIERALRELIARSAHRRIVDLFGTLDWDPGYDYKVERSRSGLR